MKLDGKALFLAKLALGIIAFAAAIYLIDWRQVWSAVGRLSISGLLLAQVAVMFEFPFLSWRWHLIVRAANPVPARRHIETYLIALFLGIVTPGQVGTDAYRFVVLRGEGVRTRPTLTLLLRERLVGLASYLLFLLVGAPLACWTEVGIPAEGSRFLLAGAGLAACGLAGIFGGRYLIRLLRLTRAGRLNRYVRDFLKLVDRASRFRSPGEAAQLLALSVFGALIPWIASFYIVAQLTGIQVGFFLIGAVVVVVELVRLIPLTIQGLGVREAVFAAVFAMVGHDPASGFVICAVCFVLLNLAVLLVGLVGYGLAFGNRELALAPTDPRVNAEPETGVTARSTAHVEPLSRHNRGH
jgi:uncharacterized membrane protein YbhN (UPF0104 family)